MVTKYIFTKYNLSDKIISLFIQARQTLIPYYGLLDWSHLLKGTGDNYQLDEFLK